MVLVFKPGVLCKLVRSRCPSPLTLNLHFYPHRSWISETWHPKLALFLVFSPFFTIPHKDSRYSDPCEEAACCWSPPGNSVSFWLATWCHLCTSVCLAPKLYMLLQPPGFYRQDFETPIPCMAKNPFRLRKKELDQSNTSENTFLCRSLLLPWE